MSETRPRARASQEWGPRKGPLHGLEPLASLSANAKRALFNPKHLRRGDSWDWLLRRIAVEVLYELKKSSPVVFVSTLLQRPEAEVLDAFREAEHDPDVRPRREIFFALVRLARPEIMIETGPNLGQTSVALLAAMQRNGCGTLHSIDLGPNPTRAADGWVWAFRNAGVGQLIPPHLRPRWRLHLGDARDVLPRLLETLGAIDIFLHDSLHTEAHMAWEYTVAWPFLKAAGLLLSHDIGVAWWRFCRQMRRPFVCWGEHTAKYGGIKK